MFFKICEYCGKLLDYILVPFAPVFSALFKVCEYCGKLLDYILVLFAPVFSALFKVCEYYGRFLDFLLVLFGLALLFSVGMQVAGRYVWFIPPYLWTLELTNFALIWSIFVGSIVGVRQGKHFSVDVFQFKGQKINPTLDKCLKILYYVILGVMTYVFIYYGWEYYVRWGKIQTSDITGVNLGWLYVAVPFSGASWALYLVEGIVRDFLMPRIENRRA